MIVTLSLPVLILGIVVIFVVAYALGLWTGIQKERRRDMLTLNEGPFNTRSSGYRNSTAMLKAARHSEPFSEVP